jgi:hypothetical protein
MFFKAAWCEAIRGGMSRAEFVGFLRDCADQIEAMTDEGYADVGYAEHSIN